jgi:hypothetical protein
MHRKVVAIGNSKGVLIPVEIQNLRVKSFSVHFRFQGQTPMSARNSSGVMTGSRSVR